MTTSPVSVAASLIARIGASLTISCRVIRVGVDATGFQLGGGSRQEFVTVGSLFLARSRVKQHDLGIAAEGCGYREDRIEVHWPTDRHENPVDSWRRIGHEDRTDVLLNSDPFEGLRGVVCEHRPWCDRAAVRLEQVDVLVEFALHLLVELVVGLLGRRLVGDLVVAQQRHLDVRQQVDEGFRHGLALQDRDRHQHACRVTHSSHLP